jgi:hypothetical protein
MTTADQQNSADQLHNWMGHGAHHWMMMICCIPMIIVTVVLVATGVVGAGFIFAAVMCVGMMWLMMRAMAGSNDT